MMARGSPPRVRGTDRTSGGVHIHRRITPACAGNSSPVSRRMKSPPDHPRVCGEQPGAPDQRGQGIGSPPRVRGTGDAHLFRAGV